MYSNLKVELVQTVDFHISLQLLPLKPKQTLHLESSLVLICFYWSPDVDIVLPGVADNLPTLHDQRPVFTRSAWQVLPRVIVIKWAGRLHTAPLTSYWRRYL